MRYLPISILCLMVSAGCNKKPMVMMKTASTVVFQGDTITFFNGSVNAAEMNIDFGDGTQSGFEDLSIQHVYEDTGFYNAEITGYNRSLWGYKEDRYPIPIKVIAKVFGCMDSAAINYNPAANVDNGTCSYNGRKAFWTNNPAYHHILFFMNSAYVGTVYFQSTTPPDCENGTGTVKVELGDGLYTYEAEYYTETNAFIKFGAGAFNVAEDTCALFRLP